jgi:hypothetical protein
MTRSTQYIATMGDNGGDRAAEINEEETRTLEIGQINHVNGIFANARALAKMSQANATIQEVVLNLYGDCNRATKMMRELGKSVGNLEVLRVLTIRFRLYARPPNAESEVAISPYWQALTSALGRVQHHIELRLIGEYFEEIYFTNLE